jgi:starch synthase (maltosyl-transferring)
MGVSNSFPAKPNSADPSGSAQPVRASGSQSGDVLTAPRRPRARPRPPFPEPEGISPPQSQGPRLYDLVGRSDDWSAQLPRIAAMGFDWLCFGAGEDEDIRRLAAEAGRHGLRLMCDVPGTDPRASQYRLIDHHRALGVRGFVVRAAHRLGPDVCRRVLADAHSVPDTLVVAETLGAGARETEALAGLGFDFTFNSARWWDLRADWLFDESERLRRIAPSIAFCERHETGKGSGDEAELRRFLELRLLLAASFSTGWMMPAGTEDAGALELSEFIATLNAARRRYPALNTRDAASRLTAPGSPVVALGRLDYAHSVAAETAVVLLLNRDADRTHSFDLGLVRQELGGRFDRLVEITPGRALHELPSTVLLKPHEGRLLSVERQHRPARRRARGASEEALRFLAKSRVVIEDVRPQIDGGRHPAKRVVGETLEVSADIFMDGHEKLSACVNHREAGEAAWQETPMEPIGNDRWLARIPLPSNATYHFTVEAWHDRFATWRAEYVAKRSAGTAVALELEEGIHLAREAAERVEGDDRRFFDAAFGAEAQAATDERETILLSEAMQQMMRRHAERTGLVRFPRELSVVADRQAALYSAWYELFPRSQTSDPSRSGTFDDVIARLPYVRDLGFDVLYFPPIHPIGVTNRKGRNNSLKAAPGDPGSPYAIGGQVGGHTAIHPELGTLDDFRRLVAAAHEHGLEIALDFAVQCSLDHPWIREHPEWFSWRGDGTIKYAENPPKKYEDIVNVDYYGAGLPELWFALRDVVLFWIDQGVKIFRVDNPHTKPLPFWEWMIGEVRQRFPEVIFLAEAFTRPKMMKKLAKLGFSQSYTYFTWRNTKAELIEYLTELSQGEPRDYYCPNFFANTPDINPKILQTGGRAAFQSRLVLAATLSSAYGIYSGYEVCEGAPLPGREEYLDSEKYEIRIRDWKRPGNITGYITAINRIRRLNPALHDFRNLRFYNAWNDNILVYGKMTASRDNVVLIAVNLDPHAVQECDFEVPLWEFGLPDSASVEVEDLLTGMRFLWSGKVQHVRLDPHNNPAALWRLEAPAQPPGVLRP